MKPRYEDISGKRFGRAVAIEYMGLDESKKRSLWKCVCDCGEEFICRKDSLKRGSIQSCGCLGKERRLEANTKHGMHNTKIYKVWTSMLQRCENPNEKAYENYGGRGIKVHPKWHSFEGFWEDMKSGYSEGLSLDRIDVDGDYEPGNVRWATRFEQQNNIRANVHVVIDGEEMTVGEASQRFGIDSNVIRSRLRLNWSHEEAVKIPVGGKQS